MIDIENELFSDHADNLRDKFPNIVVSGEEVAAPSDFPFVSIVEADNKPVERTQDSGSLENHATLMYEVNVYSNRTRGKKTECKAIFSEIDERMAAWGFTRIGKVYQTIHDGTIGRMIGRYTAVVSKNKTIYRR